MSNRFNQIINRKAEGSPITQEEAAEIAALVLRLHKLFPDDISRAHECETEAAVDHAIAIERQKHVAIKEELIKMEASRDAAVKQIATAKRNEEINRLASCERVERDIERYRNCGQLDYYGNKTKY